MTSLAALVATAVVVVTAIVAVEMAASREGLDWWVSRAERRRPASGDPRVRELRTLIIRADRGDPEATRDLHHLLTSLAVRRLSDRLGEDPTAHEGPPPRDGEPPTRLTIRRLDELVTDLEEM